MHNPGWRIQVASLLNWGVGAEEILHAITQSFELSKCPEQGESEATGESDLLYQAQESLWPSYYENNEMILGHEGPNTPTDDALDFSQHDLSWFQDSGDTLEVCPQSMGTYHQPTLQECDEEILGQSTLLLSEATAVEYKEEEMLL